MRLNPIAGTPLRDGFNFAQTIFDDYGRPYGQGLNAIVGASGRAVAGAPGFLLPGRVSNTPAEWRPIRCPSASRSPTSMLCRSLPCPASRSRISSAPFEAYVALKSHNWELSFGQQSLLWSPDSRRLAALVE